MEQTLLKFLLEIGKTAAKSAADGQNKSLIEYGNPALVRAVTLVESDLLMHEEIESVMQFVQSSFTAIYLSALSIAASETGEVKILRTLNKLNPNSDAIRANSRSLSGSAIDALASDLGLEAYDASDKKNDPPQPMGSVKDQEYVSKVNSLALGKVVETRFGNDTVNISIGLAPNYIDSEVVVGTLVGGGEDISYLGRLNKMRSGMASLSEWVLCTDLLDEHRRTLGRDKSGVYHENEKRRKTKLKQYITGNVSVARASNIYVVTSDTIDKVGRALRGDFDDMRIRERFFEDSLGMMVVVVNTRRDRVEVYYRSRSESHDYSLREIKSKGASDGTVNDLLKSLVQNNTRAPSF